MCEMYAGWASVLKLVLREDVLSSEGISWYSREWANRAKESVNPAKLSVIHKKKSVYLVKKPDEKSVDLTKETSKGLLTENNLVYRQRHLTEKEQWDDIIIHATIFDLFI